LHDVFADVELTKRIHHSCHKYESFPVLQTAQISACGRIDDESDVLAFQHEMLRSIKYWHRFSFFRLSNLDILVSMDTMSAQRPDKSKNHFPLLLSWHRIFVKNS
jgi:hypothetical protein